MRIFFTFHDVIKKKKFRHIDIGHVRGFTRAKACGYIFICEREEKRERERFFQLTHLRPPRLNLRNFHSLLYELKVAYTKIILMKMQIFGVNKVWRWWKRIRLKLFFLKRYVVKIVFYGYGQLFFFFFKFDMIFLKLFFM